jgi:hypothetical protein
MVSAKVVFCVHFANIVSFEDPIANVSAAAYDVPLPSIFVFHPAKT